MKYLFSILVTLSQWSFAKPIEINPEFTCFDTLNFKTVKVLDGEGLFVKVAPQIKRLNGIYTQEYKLHRQYLSCQVETAEKDTFRKGDPIVFMGPHQYWMASEISAVYDQDFILAHVIDRHAQNEENRLVRVKIYFSDIKKKLDQVENKDRLIVKADQELCLAEDILIKETVTKASQTEQRQRKFGNADDKVKVLNVFEAQLASVKKSTFFGQNIEVINVDKLKICP